MSGVLRADSRPAQLLVALARLRQSGQTIAPQLLNGPAMARLWELELLELGTTTLTEHGELAAGVLEAGLPHGSVR